METLVAKAKSHLQEKLPFVLYCKPNSKDVIGFFQKNDTLFTVSDFTEKGFVFASFDGKQTYLIPEKESELLRVPFFNSEKVVGENTLSSTSFLEKDNFEKLVRKGIESIRTNEFKKVVLSRKETVSMTDFDLFSVFENAVKLYPSTFVYCFYHPQVGTWLGATPEQLVKASNSTFETISLAGTQKDIGAEVIYWHQKEQDEQQFVTDYIVAKIETVASQLQVTKPFSIRAGAIWHIKTSISGQLNADTTLQKVIQLLHPTPAVCGLPMETAKDFIIKNEFYDRTFYTGFLGELNISDELASPSSNLFVNLRCMQIVGPLQKSLPINEAITQAYIYVGCGVTKDSIPEKEWEESVNKTMTMKKVLL